ncbi:hypothetical protein AAG589_18505 [Isoptericola sp. F-RaC21]|uniref:hypothetical protein n=1 Tax=Isoptericola sp. F-RaC21 TaxID=3141452 RepID=UPI00315BC148
MSFARRGGVVAAVGLGLLVVATVVLFTVPLADGLELALQVVWVLLVVALCWGTARAMRHRQRARVPRVTPDGAGQTDELRHLDRRTLIGQEKQPHRL